MGGPKLARYRERPDGRPSGSRAVDPAVVELGALAGTDRPADVFVAGSG